VRDQQRRRESKRNDRLSEPTNVYAIVITHQLTFSDFLTKIGRHVAIMKAIVCDIAEIVNKLELTRLGIAFCPQ
jgi:hypothetical protein